MSYFAPESLIPGLSTNRRERSPKLRGIYEFDVDSLEYISSYEEARSLRQQIYDRASELFKSSPKILQQLAFNERNKDSTLALFNPKFPINPLNSLLLIKRFLNDRAEILVHPQEKSQISILLNFVDELISQTA